MLGTVMVGMLGKVIVDMFGTVIVGMLGKVMVGMLGNITVARLGIVGGVGRVGAARREPKQKRIAQTEIVNEINVSN